MRIFSSEVNESFNPTKRGNYQNIFFFSFIGGEKSLSNQLEKVFSKGTCLDLLEMLLSANFPLLL